MWLVQERRLGRVGALMWSSYASAASILVLATTTRVTALFAVTSLLVLFFSGERDRELAVSLRTTIRPHRICIAQPIHPSPHRCCDHNRVVVGRVNVTRKFTGTVSCPCMPACCSGILFDLSSSVILWEEIAIEACWALARLPPFGFSRLAMTCLDPAARLWLVTRCCIRPFLKITRLACSIKPPVLIGACLDERCNAPFSLRCVRS